MNDLRFVDANCMIGRRSCPNPETPYLLEQYLADYEYCDIHAGLVHHAEACQYSQDYGNRKLLDEIAGQPRLMPQWVVMPHHTYEMAPPEDLVDEMLQRNVRAARIFPKSHGFGTHEAVVGPLLTKLQAHRIPVFVDVAELDVVGALQLAKRYPELPVVLCNLSWASDRITNAMLGEAPNLHLDTWSLQGHRAYERFVELFGSERLLFSTGLPERSPGATKMMTLYESITPQDRVNIAGGNLMRLLSNVSGAQGDLPDLAAYGEHDDDPVVAKLRCGEPLDDEFIIDAHSHIAHEGAMGYYGCALAYNDVDGLVGTMDRLGIDIAMPSTWGGIRMGTPEHNDIATAAHDKYPHRILPYGCINPSYPDLIEQEMPRVFESGRVFGFKPYPPGHQRPLIYPGNERMLKLADERQWPVLCHMGFSSPGSCTPDHVAQAAASYPGAHFLCAHSGQSWPMAQAVVNIARQHRNIYAEITYTAIIYNFAEYFVREVSAEQLIFGTDCVMRDAAPQLGWVAWARLPIEDKRLALGGNMARILRLPPNKRVPTKRRSTPADNGR